MDILSALGSVASLIGLTMQVMNDYEKEHPDEVGKAMGALKALSVRGKSWKDIHARYHSIDRHTGNLLAAIEEIDSGQRVKK
ncbi:hypothetical protein CGH36_23435, partial [Vibrio parahaemolyticus]